jgi:hypothetical protein
LRAAGERRTRARGVKAILPGEVRSLTPMRAKTRTLRMRQCPKTMMSTKTYAVGKVHRRATPGGGATGPVNHRSAPASTGTDRESYGGI